MEQGHCFICCKKLTQPQMEQHVLTAHQDGQGIECWILRIESEGRNGKKYWLYCDIPVKSSLNVLDHFLRDIWVDCCGHRSRFVDGDGHIVGKTQKLDIFRVGERLLYSYDSGDPTDIEITILSSTLRVKPRGVRLIARNQPYRYKCGRCGKPAEFINPETFFANPTDNSFYCYECARQDEQMQRIGLRITNSPRMGVCAYEGEYDDFIFYNWKSKY